MKPATNIYKHVLTSSWEELPETVQWPNLGCYGALETLLGAIGGLYWKPLGVLLGASGEPVGALGGLLGLPGGVPERSWAHVGTS